MKRSGTGRRAILGAGRVVRADDFGGFVVGIHNDSLRHLPTRPQLTFAGAPNAVRCCRAMAVDPLPFIALMGLGFVIGITGHLYRSSATIAAGIGIILVATLVPLGVYLSDR
jgi:hypothetical protein